MASVRGCESFCAVGWRSALLLPALALSLAVARAQAVGTFTCTPAAQGETTLSAATLYKQGAGAFGFDLNTAPASFSKGICGGDKPFFFSVAAPDGNYQVTLTLGGPDASVQTVRAEARRLVVDQLAVPAGGSKQVVFTVNVRSQIIASAAGTQAATDIPVMEVKLKPREIGSLDWDEKLTLEFNGDHPSVRAIAIKPVSVPTLYLAGDSTVVDQDKEPWAAWGQMLPVFFGPGLAVSNQAESGETIKSFTGERRFAKVLSTLRKGDFLMVQFAHNDQKPGAGFVSIAEYKELLTKYIGAARSVGATPILVTSMNRRNFDADGKITMTLGEYPQAMRDVAAEQHVALIDLNTMSKTLFEALGPEGTLHAFVHYPANTFPDQPKPLADDTHFNSYGAYELASAVVQSMRDQKLPLAGYLRPGIAAFDPAHPEPFAEWKLPASPNASAVTPYGR